MALLHKLVFLFVVGLVASCCTAQPRSRAPAVNLTSFPSLGMHVVQLEMGTPAREVLLIADTDSDTTWIKCADGKYDSKPSSSFKNIDCKDEACQLAQPPPGNSSCTSGSGPRACDFYQQLGGTDYIYGNLSRESFNIGGKVFRNTIFGCASTVESSQVDGVAGTLGLSPSSLAFPAQLGLSAFSYCVEDFHPATHTGKLVLGRLQGNNKLQYTPVLSKIRYNVGVENVTIAGKLVNIPPSVWKMDENFNNGTIFHTATTLTLLKEPAYTRITAVLSKAIATTKLFSRVRAGPLEFCYKVSNTNHLYKLPDMRFNFQGGASLIVDSNSYMVNQGDGVFCIAMSTVKEANIIGSLFQRYHKFEFSNSRIGFLYDALCLSFIHYNKL